VDPHDETWFDGTIWFIAAVAWACILGVITAASWLIGLSGAPLVVLIGVTVVPSLSLLLIGAFERAGW
jgi:hypothetical protein